jgi:hypothetical protein
VRRAEGAPSLSVRLVLYAAACALLGWHVARVQEPSLRASVVVALALLGLAPALAAVAGGRLAAVGVVAAAVVAAAFRTARGSAGRSASTPPPRTPSVSGRGCTP